MHCKYRNYLSAFVFFPVAIGFSYIHSCLLYEQLTKTHACRGKVSWLLGRIKTFVRVGKTFPPAPRTHVRAAGSMSADQKHIWKLNSPSCGVTEEQGFIFVLLSLRILKRYAFVCCFLGCIKSFNAQRIVVKKEEWTCLHTWCDLSCGEEWWSH